jgi:hypothetical protein
MALSRFLYEWTQRCMCRWQASCTDSPGNTNDDEYDAQERTG